MIEITRAHRMRVQFDAAKVYDPGKPSGVIDNDFFCGSSGWERQDDCAQPWRPLLWRALLIKCLRLSAVDETLEDDRPVANSSQRARRNGKIILNEFELGDFCLR